MNEKLRVFSGKCCQCDVGVDTGHVDADGNKLHTGDIVATWYGDYIGTGEEQWLPTGNLTVVVSDQYQSYSDGSIVENPNPEPYVMGIRGCGFDSDRWRVQILKKYSDVVPGEHWPAWGFSYRVQAES